MGELKKPVVKELDLSGINSSYAILIQARNGKTVGEINADQQMYPASLTKMMTCLVAIEELRNLNKEITLTQEMFAGLYEQNAATVGILAGETLTVKELLYALMIPSAADAANILADYIGGGSIENFVVMMNDFVKKLGCENTTFINAHGLDENGGNITTAYDLYKIAKYALENPTFKEITSTLRHEIAPTNKYPYVRYLNNTNKMMNPAYKDYYSPYISGVKTGTTALAGHCVISTASKNGYNYMLIVMNAPQYDIDGDNVEENVAFTDSKKIYEWAFKNIVLTKVTNTTDVVTVVDVKYNWKVDHLRLLPAKEISALVPSGTESGSLVIRPVESETPKVVKAPIKKGDVIGKAEILYGEDIVATVDLVAGENVSRSIILVILDGIKTVVSSTVFKILFVLFAVLIIIYILLIIRRNRIKAKRKKIRMIKG